MKVTRFRTATVINFDGKLIHVFSDGRANVFDGRWLETDENYQRWAAWAGYGDDWLGYAIEHELTHHWLADRLALRWSWSLHDNPPQPWPEHVAWEEHWVNAWQRLCRAGTPDKFGAIQAIARDDEPAWMVEWCVHMADARRELGL